MLKKLDNMNIRKKLDVGYAIIFILVVIIIFNAVAGMVLSYNNIDTYIRKAQKADTLAKECRLETNIAAKNVLVMAIETDSSARAKNRENINASVQCIEESLAELKSIAVLENELFQKYEENLNRWIEIGETCIAGLEDGRYNEVKATILEQYSEALEVCSATAGEIEEVTNEKKMKLISDVMVTILSCLAVIGVSFVLSILLMYRVGKKIVWSITAPLREIESVAREMVKGNLSVVPEYEGKDEIGAVAKSLKASINILSSYIKDIDHIMSEFSRGNFTVGTKAKFIGDFEHIENAFMDFEGNMSKVVKDMQKAAKQVAAVSEQVSKSSTELAEGASEQAGITEELSVTIEEIAERIRETAGNAKTINEEVFQVAGDLESSNGKMKEMVESMDAIQETSNEIGKIIASINDIASQTNLLALNASIEAARAGEAGKGFSVVANQVSALASQSAQAAKESTILIEASVHAVEKGMVIAEETARRLQGVVGGAADISTKVEAIAKASEEQADSISQITRGVENINDVVQTNSATSEECAATSENMTDQAEILEGLVKQFNVRS